MKTINNKIPIIIVLNFILFGLFLCLSISPNTNISITVKKTPTVEVEFPQITESTIINNLTGRLLNKNNAITNNGANTAE